MASAPNLTRVTRLGLVNAYVVADEDGLTVVDTTIKGGHSAILAAAGRLGLPIRRIVLTHAHGDHVGGLDALRAALPEAEVLISSRDAILLAGDKTPQPGEPADAKFRGSYPGTRATPTRTVEAGDRIGVLEVVPAPGHTPGQIALLDTRDRTLICGDAFHTVGGVATSAKAALPFPLPGLATWHPPTALATAKALRALDPERLAPGHGKVVERPGDAMDAAIAKAA